MYKEAQHAACVVHLWRNVQAIYKTKRLANLVSAAARAFTVTEFNRLFLQIQKINPACAAYLVDIGIDIVLTNKDFLCHIDIYNSIFHLSLYVEMCASP